MALEYSGNIIIADLTLEIQPEQYTHDFKKYGSYKRTIGGGIVEIDINKEKLIVNIKSLAQSQTEEIKKRCVLNKEIDFVDFVPIAEKDAKTRTVYEDLGSEVIDSQTVYLYIPTYKIIIFNFIPVFAKNVMSYTIVGEET